MTLREQQEAFKRKEKELKLYDIIEHVETSVENDLDMDFDVVQICDNELVGGGMILSFMYDGTLITIDTTKNLIYTDGEQGELSSDIAIAIDMYCHAELNRSKAYKNFWREAERDTRKSLLP